MSLRCRRGKLVSLPGRDAGVSTFSTCEILLLYLSCKNPRLECDLRLSPPPSVDDGKTDSDLVNLAYWIAFGPHGPRALPPPGQNWFIFWSVMGITGVCCVVFFIIRLFARAPPSTMTREWQEATNEYLRVRSHPRFRLPH